MERSVKDIKKKIAALSAVALVMGGVSAQAKNNNTNNDDNDQSKSVSVSHDVAVAHNSEMRSFHEFVSAKCGNKQYVMSSFAMVEDIGGGYKTMFTSYSKNDKEKSSKTLIAPDGREIDLGFYNAEGFMFPSDKIVHWEPIAGENSTELLNSSDPKEIKNHNDNWVAQQCELALKHMDNSEDLAAFRRLVGRDRLNLESEGALTVGAHKVNGVISDYLAQSNSREEMKDLNKTYRQIVKEGNKRYRNENLTQKVKANDVSNIASMNHIWNGGMAD